MRTLGFLLAVSLSLTSLSLFKIGLAEFTVFHAISIIVGALLAAKTVLSERPKLTLPIGCLVLAIYITCSNLYVGDFKVTSYLYSIVTIIEFIILFKISRTLEIEDVRKIAKSVILIFFISIVVETCFIFLHISPPGILKTLFPIYDYAGQIRPMGLSNEPSYAALTLVFALYVLIRCDNFAFNTEEAKYYLFAVIGILLTVSSYGYMMLALMIIYYVIKGSFLSSILRFLFKNPSITIILLAAIVSGFVFLILNVEGEAFSRLARIYKIVTENGWDVLTSINTIAYVDGSASMRILPTVQLIEFFSAADLKVVFFGKGAGQSTVFYTGNFGMLTQVGFIPAFIYNYGIVGFIVCLYCLKAFFPKRDLLLIVLCFLFFFNADLNTQIFIYVIFMAMLATRIERLEFYGQQQLLHSLPNQTTHYY